jgi:hypothetical protein
LLAIRAPVEITITAQDSFGLQLPIGAAIRGNGERLLDDGLGQHDDVVAPIRECDRLLVLAVRSELHQLRIGQELMEQAAAAQ